MAQVPQIYSILSDGDFTAINTVPEIYDDLVIPIGFKSLSPGTYTITVNDFDIGDKAIFEDMYEGKIVDLKDLRYRFNTSAGQFDDRFRILFNNEDGFIKNEPDVQIYSHEDAIYIKANINDATIGEVKIYNVLGNLIKSVDNNQAGLVRIVVGHLSGVYFVKFKNKYGVYTKKVFIGNE